MKSSKKTKLITVHLDEGEFRAFFALYEKSYAGSFSAYARSVLLQKPLVVKYHNDSIDNFLASMLDLKRDLKGLLSHLGPPMEIGYPPDTGTPEMADLHKKILASTEAILSKVSALYQLWLQSPG